MPKSYRIFRICEFPDIDKQDFSSPQPRLIPDSDTDEPRTQMVRQNTPLPSGFQHYYARHEFLEERAGRVHGRLFSKFVTWSDVELYLNRSERLLLASGRKDAIYDLIDSLQPHGFLIDQLDLDFAPLAPYLTNLHGAWFRHVDPSLRTSAYFGVGVDSTPWFNEAKKYGELSSIHIVHEYDGAEIRLQLTHQAAVVIQSRINDTNLELEIVLHVKRRLLDYGLCPHQRNPRKPRAAETDRDLDPD